MGSVPGRFVLLDRDGVINQRIPGGYVTSWAQFRFLPGVLEALRALANENISVLIVSNQACVGKGLVTWEELDEITRRFLMEVERNGGKIQGVYYCPHRPEDACDCRKPKPGLLVKAQSEHGFNFKETPLIGDSETDLVAAKSVGCPGILVTSGVLVLSAGFSGSPIALVKNLAEAVELIVGKAQSLGGHRRV
jgi:D-glycero-D-manno-heptose 1,7-bisphosphate phosphatase